MPKPPHKKHKPSRGPAPQSAARPRLEQVLERAQTLLDAGQMDEAIALLESNQGQLSQFAPFRAALAVVYGRVGRHREAAIQARMALDLDPQQPDYYRQAAISYYMAGYYTFAHRARQQWLRFTISDPLLASMRELDQDHRRQMEELRVQYHLQDVKVVEEAGYRLDEGQWAVARQDWPEALRHSQAAAALMPDWPPPHNNIATALSFLGRHAEAIAEAKMVLAAGDPENLHAIASLVRFHVAIGDLKTAGEYADRLAHLPRPVGRGNVDKMVEGLAFCDRDTDIARILTEARQRDDDLSPMAYMHWGIAEANAGHAETALAHLQFAQELGYDTPLLKNTIEALERKRPGPGIASRFPQTHVSDLIRREALQEAIQLLGRDSKTGRRDERGWADLLRRYPQLPRAARRMLYEMPDSVEPMAQLLAALRTPEAIAMLREFVTGQQGSVEERMAGLRALQQTGQLSADEPLEMWVRGKRHTIQPMLQEISDEFIPDYAPAVWQLYEQAVAAQNAGRLDEAERLYEAMLKLEPNAKEAYNNLASIYQARGENARSDAAIEKSLAIDPLYPFPRTAKALAALKSEGVEAAKNWLAPLGTIRQWHPLGFVVYQKALARIAVAEKDYERARNHLDAAKQFNEDDREIPGLLEWVRVSENLAKFSANLAEMGARQQQRRLHKPLPADPSLDDCLGQLTKGDMVGISHVVPLGTITAFKKDELRQHLQRRFSDADFVARIVGALGDREQTALRDLLDHGGVMTYDAFTQAYGAEDKLLALEHHASTMTSIPGRLRARGLLFVGTAEGRVIVATPRELRPIVREALEKMERKAAGEGTSGG